MSDSESDLEAIENHQNALYASMKKVLPNYKKDAATRKTQIYFQKRIEKVNEMCNQFRANDKQLILNKYSSDSDYFTKELSDIFEELYLDTICVLQNDHDQKFVTVAPQQNQPVNSSVNNNQNDKNPSARLCKIQIPTFEGSYTDWPHYRDMFSSLVLTNNQLSKIEKFWYLKSSLRGEPYDMLKHMVTTEENFTPAWKLLTEYYENPRELFRSVMHLFSSQSKINDEDPHKIRSLLSVSRECRQALTNFDIDLNHCDPILVYFITQKLPSETIGFWETKIGSSSTLPTFDVLQSFLDTRVKTLEAVAESKASSTSSSKQLPFSSKSMSSSTSSTSNRNLNHNTSKVKKSFHVNKNTNQSSSSTTAVPCFVCNELHILRKCPKFLAMSTFERRNIIQGKTVCFNCLANDHFVNKCSSRHNCRCGQRHHTLIHIDNAQPPTAIQATATHVTSDSVQMHLANLAHRQILLSTAIVQVQNSQGQLIELRALIDKGSEASLITQRALKQLNLPELSVKATISGISDVPASSCNKVVHLNLHSKVNDYEIDVSAFVMKKLTNLLPQKMVYDVNWSHIAELPLADPQFYKPDKIDLLLGSDVYSEIIRDGLRKCKGLPTAQNTEFGWILMGAIDSCSVPKLQIKSMVTKVEIDKLLQRFWEVDGVSSVREMSSDEKLCEEWFNDTTTRTLSGRYSVRLPFRAQPNAVLGKSRQMAINQFAQLERKFIRDPVFHAKYSKVFNDYATQNQLEPVSTTEEHHTSYREGRISVSCCYLPHHAVFKDSSSTTKLRIVFDASRKTTNGNSLNDVLFAGPVMHNDLPSVITNWRFHKVAFTADLEQMFRQILVHPDDIQFQRVVWRNAASEPLQEYMLKTVTFGTTCAPYLAIRTLKQLSHDLHDKFPMASHLLESCSYVDDVFGGASNIEHALLLQQQVIGMCEEAKFHLRKWVSNNETILKAVPEEDRELVLPFSLNLENSVKTLGISWQPNSDTFQFKFNFELPTAPDEVITKRSVLSTIARLYDPLGFITPVLLPAKLLMRDLWLENLDWDEPVSQDLRLRWRQYLLNLQELPKLNIPRWIATDSQSSSIEIHGFCDASKDAYAASIYLRSVDTQGQFHCHLLTSKSKIAPIKTTSIPRLELMGAVLLSVLIDKVVKNWKVSPVPKVFAWTDSQIVLHWLNGDANRWEIFVANRVNKIQEIIPNENWRHVISESNPADISTRGMTVSDIIENTLWWHGPAVLRMNVEFIISSPQQFITRFAEADHRQVHVQRINISETIEILQRFSSYNKLLRTTARIHLLAKRARHQLVILPTTVDQLNIARNFWIRAIQIHEFPHEMKLLSEKGTVGVKSKLLNLNPFIDVNGIMRVGGRLANSHLNFDEKFPMILPSQNHFTKLLISECHQLTLHGGTQIVLTWLRKKYWILNARNTIRFHILKCITCYRMRAKGGEQRMGILPSPRVQPSPIFQSTGIDFAGPIQVKASSCRGKVKYKGYICIFVCLSVRAIHLELAGDLSTATFLAVLK